MNQISVGAISSIKPIETFSVASDITAANGDHNLLSKAAESFLALSDHAKQVHMDLAADLKLDATNPLTILEVQRKMTEEGSKVSLLNGVVHKLGSTVNDLLKS